MKETLKDYCILQSANVLDALKKIDKNTKGFVILVNEEDVVCGVLTDGDIRRAFMHGNSLETAALAVCRRDIICLTDENDISEAIEQFKNGAIKFLPIVDYEYKLKNIITKRQMYSLLLQDIQADLSYDFSKLDENIIDHEIFPRPWGFYKTTVMNDYFQSKIISVKPKEQLSLQSHSRREEHWIVAHGKGTAQIEDRIVEIGCGSSVFIPCGCKHRLTNTDKKERLIVIEVQLGNYFGEDDIIRYEDRYGRQ